MIVQETTVGEDDRAIGLGGKDTFFGVVDGMSQCIDVISAMLYVRDVLDIASILKLPSERCSRR